MDEDSDFENENSLEEEEEEPIITIDVGETSADIIDILWNLGPFCQNATYEQMKFFLVFLAVNINFTKDDLQKYRDDGFSEFSLRQIMTVLALWSTTNEINIKFVAEFLKKTTK
jgi:hypothetical protein